jgi:GTP pyrophosphokinase
VSVHRADCSNFRDMAGAQPERVIEVAWGTPQGADAGASTRWMWRWRRRPPGPAARHLEVFAKEKMNVIGVQTQSVKGTAWMTFTVEVADSAAPGQGAGAGGQRAGVRRRAAALPGLRGDLLGSAHRFLL